MKFRHLALKAMLFCALLSSAEPTLINTQVAYASILETVPRALVVIDMQVDFLNRTSNPVRRQNIIDHVIEEIRKSKAAHEPIINIVYDLAQYGAVEPAIAAELQNYSGKLAQAEKFHNSGSAELATALDHLFIRPQALRVVGINTNACVIATVEGAPETCPYLQTIEVVESACDHLKGDDISRHKLGIYYMSLLPKVRIERETAPESSNPEDSSPSLPSASVGAKTSVGSSL